MLIIIFGGNYWMELDLTITKKWRTDGREYILVNTGQWDSASNAVST